MAELMLRCPMTDRNFSTGINIDERSSQSLPDTVSSVHCPRCGRAHWWRPHDAWMLAKYREPGVAAAAVRPSPTNLQAS
jgi:hypothetical protein